LLANSKLGLAVVALAALAGCTRNYSPNTYSSAAAQQANKVVQGVVAGFRQVEITPDGTVGTVTGGAAGGILGSQAPGGGVTTALSALGGTVVGGLFGTAIEKSAGTTTGFEYLVRKADGELLSVTQKDPTPLAVGQKVLLIEGNQARIVPDYSVPAEPAVPPAVAAPAQKEAPASAAPTAAPAAAGPANAPGPGPAPAEAPPTPLHPSPTAAAEAPASKQAEDAQPNVTSGAEPAPAARETAPASSEPSEPDHPAGE
jgi:outer membrane lipoprotein SlyB